jgi:hypothetical protein
MFHSINISQSLHIIYDSNVRYFPITVAALSKAWTVFACSNTRIVGSNPTWGMVVCVRLFCVCVVLCVGSGIVTGSSPSKESYRLRKNDKETEMVAKVQQRAVESWIEKYTLFKLNLF